MPHKVGRSYWPADPPCHPVRSRLPGSAAVFCRVPGQTASSTRPPRCANICCAYFNISKTWRLGKFALRGQTQQPLAWNDVQTMTGLDLFSTPANLHATALISRLFLRSPFSLLSHASSSSRWQQPVFAGSGAVRSRHTGYTSHGKALLLPIGPWFLVSSL